MGRVRRVVALAFIAGCAASSREAQRAHEHEHAKERVDLSVPPPIDHTASHTSVAAARPDVPRLDLRMPDPERELRWPLGVSAHPALDPSFAIAPALAEPGIAWTTLCARGVQNRYGAGELRDLTAYLRAWCVIEDRDLDAGLDQLAKLTSSVVRHLAPAVRLDIVSVLAAGDAGDAERMLAGHKLSSLERLDLLAATFVELGKRDDAYAINTLALEGDRHANHADSCRRLARELALGPRDERDVPLEQLRVLAEADKPDPLCVQLYAEIACWAFLTRDPSRGFSTVAARCSPYLNSAPMTPGEQKAMRVYVTWPHGPVDDETWVQLAVAAADGVSIEGVDQLVTTALEAAVRAGRCAGPSTTNAGMLAQRILFEPSRKPTVDDARLKQLIDAPAALCAP